MDLPFSSVFLTTLQIFSPEITLIYDQRWCIRHWKYFNIPAILVKGELGEFQIYFRKISLHQQKFLMVSVLSNSPWLLRNLKNVQNETTKHFSVGNTFL